jgi:ketosteroid isomerase-like protein
VYKATVRALIRRSIARLNQGDPSMMVKMAAPDVELIFSGDNSWSTMYRPVVKSRERFVTHRGIEEARGFGDRFVAEGIQFAIEDILVNGPPWNMRVAVRANDYIPGPDGRDVYNNRFVDFFEIRWGRIIRLETFEDTERVAEWDRRQAATTPA